MSSQQPKILIFDDRRKSGPLAEIILATGMYSEITSVIARGIEICEQTDFEAIIVDTDFNRGVGIEFITTLRQQNRNQFTPILAMSRAKPQSEIKSTTEAQATGADDFLKRPIKRSKVLSRLTKLLGREIKIIENSVAKPTLKKKKKSEKKVSPAKKKTSKASKKPKSSLREEKAELSQFQTPVEAERSRSFAKKLNFLRNKDDKVKILPESNDDQKQDSSSHSKDDISVESQVEETAHNEVIDSAIHEASKKSEDAFVSDKIIETSNSKNQIEVLGDKPVEEESIQLKDSEGSDLSALPESESQNESASFIGEAFFDDLDDLSSENEMNFVDLVQSDQEEEEDFNESPSAEQLGSEQTNSEASGLLGVLEAELERRDDTSLEEILPVPIAIDPPPAANEVEINGEASDLSKISESSQEEDRVNLSEKSEPDVTTPAAKRVRTAYGVMAEMLADRPVSAENKGKDDDSKAHSNAPETVHIPPRSQRNDSINKEAQNEPEPRNVRADAGWNEDQIAKVTAGVIAAAETSAKEAIQEAFNELFSRLPPALFQPETAQETEDTSQTVPLADTQIHQTKKSEKTEPRREDQETFGDERLIEVDLEADSLTNEERINPSRFIDRNIPAASFEDAEKNSEEIIGDGTIAHLFDALLLIESLRKNSPSGRLCLGEHIVIEIEAGLPVCRSGSDVTTRLLLRLLDDGHIRPSEYDELMRSEIEERPDRILTYLADSSRLTPKETWNELDRLLDEALATIVRHKGTWTFFAENHRVKSAENGTGGQIEIRSRLAKVVQESFGSAALIQMFGTQKSMIEVIQWPGEFVSSGDRSFLQALDGNTKFEQACGLGAISSGRAAALVVLLLAMGFARIIVEEQKEGPSAKLDVPAWSGSVLEEFAGPLSGSPPALESANDDVISSVPPPPNESQAAETRSDEETDEPLTMQSEIRKHSVVSTPIADADAIVSEAKANEGLERNKGSDVSVEKRNTPSEYSESFIAANSVESLFSRIKTKSYYDVLGVELDAQMNEITAAYDERLEELSDLLIDLRPDRLLMAEKITQVYKEAFIVLSHKHLRERYRYFQRESIKR